MLKNKRLLLIPLLLAVAAVVILGMRIGYPHHRLTAFILLGLQVALGWKLLALRALPRDIQSLAGTDAFGAAPDHQ